MSSSSDPQHKSPRPSSRFPEQDDAAERSHHGGGQQQGHRDQQQRIEDSTKNDSILLPGLQAQELLHHDHWAAAAAAAPAGNDGATSPGVLEQEQQGGVLFASPSSLSPPTSSIFAFSSSASSKLSVSSSGRKSISFDRGDSSIIVRQKSDTADHKNTHEGRTSKRWSSTTTYNREATAARKNDDDEEIEDIDHTATITPRAGIINSNSDNNMMDHLLSAFVRLPEEFSSLSSNEEDKRRILLRESSRPPSPSRLMSASPFYLSSSSHDPDQQQSAPTNAPREVVDRGTTTMLAVDEKQEEDRRSSSSAPGKRDKFEEGEQKGLSFTMIGGTDGDKEGHNSATVNLQQAQHAGGDETIRVSARGLAVSFSKANSVPSTRTPHGAALVRRFAGQEDHHPDRYQDVDDLPRRAGDISSATACVGSATTMIIKPSHLLKKTMDDDRMEVAAPPAAAKATRDDGHDHEGRTLTPPSRMWEKKSKQTRADEATATGLPTEQVQKRKSKWQNCYLELLDYKKEHGNCNVPFAYAKLPGLAQWVKRQRYQYKIKVNGKHSHLADDRQQLLEDAGFVWDTHDAAWDENYSKMVEFWGEHGHCNVPMREKELNAWAKRQRRHYKHYNDSEKKHLSTMTEDRIVRLNEISFAWQPLATTTTTASPASSSGVVLLSSRPHTHGQPRPSSSSIPLHTSLDSAVGLIASVTTAISTSSTPRGLGTFAAGGAHLMGITATSSGDGDELKLSRPAGEEERQIGSSSDFSATTSGVGGHGTAGATSSLPASSLSTSVVDEEATRRIVRGTEEDDASLSPHQQHEDDHLNDGEEHDAESRIKRQRMMDPPR
jgi:hypothetical protein